MELRPRPLAAAYRSRGFTLVELLVVIAIIGILIALLLPAVQAARESARQVQCRNNLKNITLGVQLYHDSHKRFPPGYHYTAIEAQEEFGWQVFIMPYTEQQPLYDALGVGKRTLNALLKAKVDIPLVQQKLAIYRCPSDTTPNLVPTELRTFIGGGAPAGFFPATGNYIGNRGFNDVHGPNIEREGVLFNDSKLSFADVEDGTSNTFCIGERDERCAAATWIGSRNPLGSGMYGAFWILGRISMKLNYPINGDHDTCTEGFSSAHPGGAYFSFVDGSVRFIPDGIDFRNGGRTQEQIWTDGEYDSTKLGVYQTLGIRNDGVAVREQY